MIEAYEAKSLVEVDNKKMAEELKSAINKLDTAIDRYKKDWTNTIFEDAPKEGYDAECYRKMLISKLSDCYRNFRPKYVKRELALYEKMRKEKFDIKLNKKKMRRDSIDSISKVNNERAKELWRQAVQRGKSPGEVW